MSNEFYPVRDRFLPPNWSRTLAIIICGTLVGSLFILIFTPWQQTSQGYGKVIALSPNDRVQNINATLPGRINKWFVTDGDVVKKGDPIVEMIDNDPNFIERLKIERDAKLRKYEAGKAASETALINYQRQQDLFNQGLSARTKFEKAKITYKKLLSEEAEAAASLANAEVKFSRQQTQLVTAPRDGIILRILHGSGNVVVSEGDLLAKFVPSNFTQAAEIFIDGNDLPLVSPGRRVRLQFEGWPAVQFSGWPSVAVGTFGGTVVMVDPSATDKGKFRVLVRPEKANSWPDYTYLRQGTRVHGWILLNEVSLGYELWRQFNGFPPAVEAPDSEIQQDEGTKKKVKKDKS